MSVAENENVDSVENGIKCISINLRGFITFNPFIPKNIYLQINTTSTARRFTTFSKQETSLNWCEIQNFLN